MQTERLNRLRACARGCGVSTRMEASARSSQMRATLLVAEARALTPASSSNTQPASGCVPKLFCNDINNWGWDLQVILIVTVGGHDLYALSATDGSMF